MQKLLRELAELYAPENVKAQLHELEQINHNMMLLRSKQAGLMKSLIAQPQKSQREESLSCAYPVRVVA